MKNQTPFLLAFLINTVLSVAQAADIPKPTVATNAPLALSRKEGSKSINCRLSHLNNLGSNETAVVYTFLCRTNGPTLTESLLAAPPEDPVPQFNYLIRGGAILLYDGEVVKAASKERVGYRYLATKNLNDGWDGDDDGRTLELGFDSFQKGMGKPEWDWFGDEVTVKAVVVVLRRGEFKNGHRRTVIRFLNEPAEVTFRTKELQIGN